MPLILSGIPGHPGAVISGLSLIVALGWGESVGDGKKNDCKL